MLKRDPSVSLLIQKRFLNQRKLFLWGPVTDETAKDVSEKLLYLESTAPGKDITFYMNTPGGSITAGMAVFDTMKLISSPITIVVTGMAASMGSILLCAAAKGRRLIYPHGRVLIHQPLISGRFIGPATDINIQAQEMEKLRGELNQILADASGQPIEKISRDSDRDFYLNAKEAVAYGLADKDRRQDLRLAFARADRFLDGAADLVLPLRRLARVVGTERHLAGFDEPRGPDRRRDRVDLEKLPVECNGLPWPALRREEGRGLAKHLPVAACDGSGVRPFVDEPCRGVPVSRRLKPARECEGQRQIRGLLHRRLPGVDRLRVLPCGVEEVHDPERGVSGELLRKRG